MNFKSNVFRLNYFKNSPYYMELYREQYDSVFWKECSWIYKCHFVVKDCITNREVCHVIINEKDCMNFLSSVYDYIQYNEGEIVIPFLGNTTNPDIFMFQIYSSAMMMNENLLHPMDDLDTTDYFVIKKYNQIEQLTVDLVKFELVESGIDSAMSLINLCSYIYDVFLIDVADNELLDPGWLQ